MPRFPRRYQANISEADTRARAGEIRFLETPSAGQRTRRRDSSRPFGVERGGRNSAHPGPAKQKRDGASPPFQIAFAPKLSLRRSRHETEKFTVGNRSQRSGSRNMTS
ncbi:unnamed protein product [Lampetra planeri]